MSERFLVTGAYGCIGAWALRLLVDDGAEVIAADASPDDHRVTALLDEEERARIGFVRADISRDEDVDALFDLEPSHVLHLAALQVPACREDPVRGARVNVVGTTAMFARAARAGLATPLVYASSAAAYGAHDDGAAEPSGHPDTFYGVTKLANEEAARVFHAESGVASIGLRPYVVYGPGRDQGLTSAPTMAMRAAALGEPFTIPYSGRSQLQFARDVAAAFVAASRSGFAGAGTSNLPGHSVSVDEIVAEIENAQPSAVGTIEVTGGALPFPPELDAGAFASIVGEVAATPFADGVAATIAHYRATSSAARR
jgi:UDP-glucuronate 4-epimerase